MEKEKRLSNNFEVALEIIIRDDLKTFNIEDILSIFKSHNEIFSTEILQTLNKLKRIINEKEKIEMFKALFNYIKKELDSENLNEKDFKLIENICNICLKKLN